MIKLSEELNELLSEISSICYDINEEYIDTFLRPNSIASTNLDIDDTEELIDIGFNLSQKYGNQSSIYSVTCEDDGDIYYFVGDLKNKLIPMFKKELDKWKKKVEKVNKEYKIDAARELDEEIKRAEERVKELKKQRANKRK